MERIVVNPQIHFGKPIIEGTRVTVESVLELIGEGLSFEQIIKDYYPDLKKADIQACVGYATALVAAESMSEETAYLLSDPANAAHLQKSISETLD